MTCVVNWVCSDCGSICKDVVCGCGLDLSVFRDRLFSSQFVEVSL